MIPQIQCVMLMTSYKSLHIQYNTNERTSILTTEFRRLSWNHHIKRMEPDPLEAEKGCPTDMF